MDKTLHLLREHLKTNVYSRMCVVFSTAMLNDLLRDHRLSRDRVVFCVSSSVWPTLICNKDFTGEFDPSTSHAEILQGKLGHYQAIPFLTDGFSDPSEYERFLPPNSLFLIRVSENDEVTVLSARFIRPFDPSRDCDPPIKVEITLTQVPEELVKTRAAAVAAHQANPEKPFYCEPHQE